jgi:hypothetical protein
MTVTKSINLTFKSLTCGRFMISSHTILLLVGAFTEN